MAELARERMRAGIFESEPGDAALHWVLPAPHALHEPKPPSDPDRARVPEAGAADQAKA